MTYSIFILSILAATTPHVMQTLTSVSWSQLLPILASHKYFCPQAIPGDPEFNQVEKDKEVENSSQQAKTDSTVKHRGHNI